MLAFGTVLHCLVCHHEADRVVLCVDFSCLQVKNLDGATTKEQLDAFFSKYGTITSSMVNTTKDDKTKAFGFINFQSPEEATAAVEATNNVEFNGRKLFVGRAQKKEEREVSSEDSASDILIVAEPNAHASALFPASHLSRLRSRRRSSATSSSSSSRSARRSTPASTST
jgi:RNA recognition motif-containing protein